jgi:hypothetical protein
VKETEKKAEFSIQWCVAGFFVFFMWLLSFFLSLLAVYQSFTRDNVFLLQMILLLRNKNEIFIDEGEKKTTNLRSETKIY